MKDLKELSSGSFAKIVSSLKSNSGVKALSIPDAAKRLEVTPQAIYDWLAQGKMRPATLSIGEEGSTGRGMVVPTDAELLKKWNGETAPPSVPNNHSPETVSHTPQAPLAPPAAKEEKAAPSEKSKEEKIVELTVDRRRPFAEEERVKLAGELGFLRGRISELEKAIVWERDARGKAEREITALTQEKARLEGQLSLASRVEKSLQKYSDHLEQELKSERERRHL